MRRTQRAVRPAADRAADHRAGERPGRDSDRTFWNQSPCVVDQNTFTSDQTGRLILQEDHAVVLIPSAALAKGAYTATITQSGKPNVSWSFTEGTVPAPSPAPVAPPSTGSTPTSTTTTTSTQPGAPTTKPTGTGSAGTSGSTGASGSTGTSGAPGTGSGTGAPVSAASARPVITLAAYGARLALRGHGTTTVTITATRRGRRLLRQTMHETGAHWRAAVVLPRRLRAGGSW